MPLRDDEFSPTQLQAHVDALSENPPPYFALRVGGAFSFVSAACLTVHDDTGALQRLRRAWHHAAPGHDATPYVPHVTAGLYGGAWPMQEVHARLRELATLPEIHLAVKALDWMVYDSGRISGPLRTMLRVELATGRVQVPDRAALNATFGKASTPGFAIARAATPKKHCGHPDRDRHDRCVEVAFIAILMQ